MSLPAGSRAVAWLETGTASKHRHRLNPNGNRQLNHALHIAALGQISHDTPGRAYYLSFPRFDGRVGCGGHAAVAVS
jgi:hypothetical protein